MQAELHFKCQPHSQSLQGLLWQPAFLSLTVKQVTLLPAKGLAIQRNSSLAVESDLQQIGDDSELYVSRLVGQLTLETVKVSDTSRSKRLLTNS
eukprot:1151946-Pelagomonas_calceolata.AAC.2